MKVSILGSDGNALCQIPQLREGFESLGHTHIADYNDSDNAFLFVGNPWFDTYIEDFNKNGKQKKTIFNVLDIPVQNPNYPLENLRAQLERADKVTCISKFVQRQLKELIDVNADVIYYPMKPVKFTDTKSYPEAKVLIAGRVNDPNKRVGAVVKALIKAGYNECDIAVVGPENPHYGVYHGIVSDEKLNDLYNSVDYVMMFDHIAGIGLPAIEAACCGAIPIVLPDMTTFGEFWVQSPLGLHYQLLTSLDKIAALMRSLNDNPTWKEEVKQDLVAYSQLAFRPKFEPQHVAARIIETYQLI